MKKEPGDTAPPQSPLRLYRPDLADRLSEADLPNYRHTQVYEHLFRRPLEPFALATSLPKAIRESLDPMGISALEAVGQRSSTDGTTKFLMAAKDGALVETVVMPYRRRTTVCISCQVGCPVGCTFCATGALGFRRSLSLAEIVDQVRTVAARYRQQGGHISNLVYMGMGEPLLNLEAVLGSIRIFTDERGLNLSRRSISVSTVGIPAGILRLGRVQPQVNLAVSLHASTDKTRASLVPGKHRHTLSQVLDAAWEHFALTHRKLLVEYVLLDGVNDSQEDARCLAALLRGHIVTVNLLSWNPTGPSTDRRTSSARTQGPHSARALSFKPSSSSAVAAFRSVLLSAGVEAVVRRSRGSDIQAACGQLAGEHRGYDEVLKG